MKNDSTIRAADARELFAAPAYPRTRAFLESMS
jgi:hypothetical protein